MRRGWWAGLVVAVVAPLLVAGAPPAAAAGEIVVTTTADVLDDGDGVLSLREAVAQANAQSGADTIVLAENAEYVLTRCAVGESDDFDILVGGLDIIGEGSLTVEGNGSTLVQTCPEGLFTNAWVIGIQPGDPFWLSDVLIDGGAVGIGGWGRPLHLDHVSIVGADSGMHNFVDDGEVAISLVDSSIRDGEVGIAEIGGDVEMVRSEISENSSHGVEFVEGTVVMEDSSISDNGGYAIESGYGLTMNRSHIDRNGGGVEVGWFDWDCCPAPAPVSLDDSTIDDNEDPGLVVYEGDVELVDSSISGNSSGGVVVHDRPPSQRSQISLLRSRVVDNPDGVGLDLHATDLTSTDSSISGNGYGGIAQRAATPASNVTLSRSTVAGNGGGPSDSGGIAVSGAVTLDRSTVAGNVGVIGGAQAPELSVEHSTIAGNSGSAADEVGVGSLTSVASIVGEGGAGSDCDVASVVSSSDSIYGDDTCWGAATPPAGNLVGVDSLLGPMADNGGPTLTRMPQLGSPAIDALAPSAPCDGPDQRGAFRPQGASCDIGSVEVGVLQRFTDVPASHQFFAEIECLVALGVTEGFADGSFGPTLPISRQGVVAWLYRLAGEPDVSGVAPFSDVPATHVFHDAIVWAAEEGIAGGYGDGTFRPGQSVARQGVAAWLWRMTGEPEVDDPPSFSDVPVGSLFEEPIGWLASSGVTEGFTDGTFRPTLSISRQGLAAWICRYDDQVT